MKNGFFILVLLVLIGVSGWSYWTYQKNVYSKEEVKLELLGDETVEMGEEIEYTIKYRNNGNLRVEELKLVFEYPENALPLAGEKRVILDLEDLYPGEENMLKFRARLFGREGDLMTAESFLEYQPKNLKARYQSKSSFTSRIGSVPLTFGIDFPSKLEPGKETQISLNYFSNSKYPLSNLRARIDYPENFEFVISNPKGVDKNEWEIPILNYAEGGRIEITGKIKGNVGNYKVFKADLGIWKEDHFILLKEVSRGLTIIEPRLLVSQRINGSPDYEAKPGDLLRYEIIFRNIGNEPFEELFLVANLEGPFDFGEVRSPAGRINIADSSIFWDWRDVPKLQFLVPGEEGRVEFWINLKKEWPISEGKKNFTLKNKIVLSQLREEFETKINSRVVLAQKGYFQNEVMENSGPLPPEVGKTTTYVIIWQLKNYFNEVRETRVRARLPEGARLTGEIFPAKEQENFTFDSVSREMVWRAGDLTPGAGILEDGPSLAFQLAFTPSENQRGLVATLVGEARVSGEDQFTENILESVAPAVDTTLPDDETVTPEQGVVQ